MRARQAGIPPVAQGCASAAEPCTHCAPADLLHGWPTRQTCPWQKTCCLQTDAGVPCYSVRCDMRRPPRSRCWLRRTGAAPSWLRKSAAPLLPESPAPLPLLPEHLRLPRAPPRPLLLPRVAPAAMVGNPSGKPAAAEGALPRLQRPTLPADSSLQTLPAVRHQQRSQVRQPRGLRRGRRRDCCASCSCCPARRRAPRRYWTCASASSQLPQRAAAPRARSCGPRRCGWRQMPHSMPLQGGSRTWLRRRSPL